MSGYPIVTYGLGCVCLVCDYFSLLCHYHHNSLAHNCYLFRKHQAMTVCEQSKLAGEGLLSVSSPKSEVQTWSMLPPPAPATGLVCYLCNSDVSLV
jgi:hypothetical protein